MKQTQTRPKNSWTPRLSSFAHIILKSAELTKTSYITVLEFSVAVDHCCHSKLTVRYCITCNNNILHVKQHPIIYLDFLEWKKCQSPGPANNSSTLRPPPALQGMQGHLIMRNVCL